MAEASISDGASSSFLKIFTVLGLHCYLQVLWLYWVGLVTPWNVGS